MDYKNAKEKIHFVLCVLYIGIISTVLSQPPPPDVPITEEITTLGSTPAMMRSGDVLSSNFDITSLPTCSDLVCTLEFIPEHCRQVPILDRNGEKCSGCWQWKESCKNTQNKNQSDNKADVTCPNLTCQNIEIPPNCILQETYEYKGKICEKCPVHKAGCFATSRPVEEKSQCPVQACTLQLIPDECREIPTFEHFGVTCNGCPKWRQGCVPKSQQNTLQRPLTPQVSCPIIACDTYIPVECRVDQEFQYRGRMCTKCPRWRDGCREQERIDALNSIGGNRRDRPQTLCPNFPCIDNNIPEECKIEQPFQFRGITCFRCPIRSPNCRSGVININSRERPMSPRCPLIKCDRPAGFPPHCFQQEFITYNGNVCEKCPSLKPECSQFVPPRPNVQIDPAMAREIGTPEKSCPMLKCQSIYIPPDCLEVPLYPFDGKSCQGCPKMRDGCVSSIPNQPPSNSVPEIPSIPERKPEIVCPVKACPMIYIPDECKEEQPYQFMGITCYDCPKQKASCITINSAEQPQNIQQIQCPMFGCPRIYIPPECRVERPFTFQGRTCYMCPQWRDGCVPFPPKPNVNINSLPSQPLTTPENIITTPSRKNIPEKSCPLMRCTKIFIPVECREEQPYDYDGKICYRCPKWKDGCGARGNILETTIAPSKPTGATNNEITQNDSISIRDLKEIIPVNNIIQAVNAATCPPLRCPAMFIPLTCREDSFYQFQGRTCRGCPRWRLGCYPMFGPEMNMNANGILSYSLFNELLSL